MPNWILAPVCVVVLFGFIFYALRQGAKIKPDRNNGNFGPGDNGLGGYSDSDGGSGHSF